MSGGGGRAGDTGSGTAGGGNNTGNNGGGNSAGTPLVLSLSQIQGGGGLLILNSASSGNNGSNSGPLAPVSVASFVCNQQANTNVVGRGTTTSNNLKGMDKTLVLKQEAMETSCCHESLSLDNLKMDVTNGNVSFESSSSMSPSGPGSVGGSNMGNYSEPMLSNKSSSASTPKPMDTSSSGSSSVGVGGTGVLSDVNSQQSYHDNNTKSENHHDNHVVGFFNETLDLSQEDIQKTLSANMPSCSTEHLTGKTTAGEVVVGGGGVLITDSVVELNPMDFIDSDVSPHCDDDVFVNLDAFDMLGDFPELEVLDSGAMVHHHHHHHSQILAHHQAMASMGPSPAQNSEPSPQDPTDKSSQSSPRMDYREGTANITDYSPEWAYPEVRVIINY